MHVVCFSVSVVCNNTSVDSCCGRAAFEAAVDVRGEWGLHVEYSSHVHDAGARAGVDLVVKEAGDVFDVVVTPTSFQRERDLRAPIFVLVRN